MLFSAVPPTYLDSENVSETKTTRAATSDWPNGARLYLRFSDSGATGTAIYDAANRLWTLSFSGTLTTDEDATCEVWYFEDPASADATSATLSPTTATFHTTSATYLYHSDKVHLRASLEPTEVRFRYKGTPGTVLTIADWPHYTTFTRSSALLSNSSKDETFTLSVGSDGYTPYIYGHSEVDMLHVEIASTHFYYPLFQTVILVGRSYSTAMPTESLVSAGKWSHTSRDRTFTVTGNGKTVTFKMIYVQCGTFEMGSTTGYDNEVPVHSVTLTKDYSLGETEVTQALWYAVMGQSPTSDVNLWISTYGLGDNRPAYYISYEDCQSFLSALNNILSSQLGSGEQFRFPTEAEWEFAAKGGIKSKGYTYAGSNAIDDVAWYCDNSGHTTKPVKTKAANELGLFDISGNVWEWCYDWFDYYSSSAQTDPTGPSERYWNDRILRGGNWGCNAGNCTVAHRSCGEPTQRYDFTGLRLCLGAPIE